MLDGGFASFHVLYEIFEPILSSISGSISSDSVDFRASFTDIGIAFVLS